LESEKEARERAEEVSTSVTSRNLALGRELAQVKLAIEVEIQARRHAEQEAAVLAQAKEGLAVANRNLLGELSRAKESESLLVQRCANLEADLERTRCELDRENRSRQAAEKQVAASNETNAELRRQLNERLEAEAGLQKLKDETERRLEQTAQALDRTGFELKRIVAERDEAHRELEALGKGNRDLSRQLLELAQASTCVQKAKSELEKQFEQTKIALAEARQTVEKERAERERIDGAFGVARQEWSRQHEENRLEIANSRRALEIEVSERKRVEACLARSRYLALEEMRAKTECLESLHGKVRSSMNRMLSVATELLEGEMTDTQRACVETLLAGAGDLAGTLNGLGGFLETRPSFGTFQNQDLNPGALAEAILDELRHVAEANDTDAVSIVYQDVPAVLRGDSGRLCEVLRHMLRHAIMVADKGEVLLHVRKEQETDAVAVIRFEVEDTGHGLSEQAQRGLEKLASEQEQVSPLSLDSSVIGLAVARHLVEMMGGQFGVSCSTPLGSVRWFTLPLTKSSTTTVPSSCAREPFSGWHVLLASHDRRKCRIMGAQLAALGVRTTVAASGVDALTLLRQEPTAGQSYAAAILAQELPEMTAVTLARIIKTDPALARTRLVLMNDAGKPISDEQLKHAGFDAQVCKPFRQSKVETCLTRLRKHGALPG
jgi:signal transduction histidine kinase